MNGGRKNGKISKKTFRVFIIQKLNFINFGFQIDSEFDLILGVQYSDLHCSRWWAILNIVQNKDKSNRKLNETVTQPLNTNLPVT